MTGGAGRRQGGVRAGRSGMSNSGAGRHGACWYGHRAAWGGEGRCGAGRDGNGWRGVTRSEA